MQIEILPAIARILPEEWNALAGAQPFLQHAFLDGLERTACVGGDSGWQPMHATLRGDNGQLLAAMPLYAKSHSYGEFVFDWAWAEASERAGIRYYPKALAAIPFSPVPGLRTLAREDAHRRALLAGVIEVSRSNGLGSLHILFADEATLAAGDALGMHRRHAVQFHWHSAGEQCFDDFLARMSHDKRKKIRQERRKVSEAGVSLRWIEGPDITAADWAFFVRCYEVTYALHRSTPYLTLDFFLQLGERLPQACVLVVAERGASPIAASLMLRDEQALYGRYWGAVEYVPCLHFEACYHQGIEYAIARGLKRFEGGAQGEHKLARGMDPVQTTSLHWLADPGLDDAVGRHLQRERAGISAYVDELSEHSAFRTRPGG
ncbi:GNAT family N-acetyltransferase [Niveibacterium sp. 24ML]|uniref:GNAT family N-acetyltransferase n=1 Tax=Niveibacterium sp. 24ML TaxID=2985512 RepID=UPI002270CC36|nr:GNAT family N-acetyltransferase [Niveibacterium sp. 24ML]MCX9156443.1 GNAT family N-acetyltransferase [Niveibacterium sp. 24ML]